MAATNDIMLLWLPWKPIRCQLGDPPPPPPLMPSCKFFFFMLSRVKIKQNNMNFNTDYLVLIFCSMQQPLPQNEKSWLQARVLPWGCIDQCADYLICKQIMIEPHNFVEKGQNIFRL